MDTNSSLLKSLGVTSEQMIGYAYAGLLAALCYAIVDAQSIKALIEALGAFLSTLVFLGLGIGIYTFYFLVLGEFILYPLQHLIHLLIDKICKQTGKKHTSAISLIGFFGVPLGYRRSAYEAIKSSFFNIEDRKRIQLAHGELHVLYLTAVEFTVVAIYLRFFLGNTNPNIVILAIIAYIGALIGDIRQHSLEAYKLNSYGQEKVKEFLSSQGFIPEIEGTNNSALSTNPRSV